jgi:hypothetical protein
MEQVMHQDLSERIRERAYEIWIASGYRDGEADQHWLAAEQEILSGPRSAAVAKTPAKRIRGQATVKRSEGRPDWGNIARKAAAPAGYWLVLGLITFLGLNAVIKIEATGTRLFLVVIVISVALGAASLLERLLSHGEPADEGWPRWYLQFNNPTLHRSSDDAPYGAAATDWLRGTRPSIRAKRSKKALYGSGGSAPT